MLPRACFSLLISIMLFPLSLPGQKSQSKQKYFEWVKTRKAYQRVEWFNKQRRNPDGTIPVEIYWAERDRVIREQRRLGKQAVGHIEWKTVGPHGVNALPAHWGVTSGRVRGLAVHPQDPQTVYIGVAAGGIWKTTDGGVNWTSLGDDLESLTFGAIAIDPQNPETVYAGTGEARFNFNTVTYDGKGLFKSTDGGATWTEITTGFGTQTHFAALAVAPNVSNVVYAALASGSSNVGNLSNEGIWRSGDGGQTWTQVIPINDAFDIVPHPARSGDVFAGIGGGDNDSSGVWFSSDFGLTWTRMSNGLPDSDKIDRIQLAIARSGLQPMYAIVFTAGDATRIFKSADDGANWTQVATGISGDFGAGPMDQGGYDLFIAVNPRDANDVWAGNVELYHSTDGETFNRIRNIGFFNAWDSPMHVDYHIMRFAPSNANVIYVGNDGGIYGSTDGGGSWQALNAGLNTLQFYRVASSPHNVNTLIGGAQDNGIIGKKSAAAGSNQRWDNLSTGDGFDCFFDPANPNIVYASTQNVNLYKSTNGLDGFNFIGIPTAGRITNGIPDNERNAIFFAPFFMHPTDPQTLFTATTRVYRTTDGGENWTALSQPLIGTNNPLQSVAISRSNPQILIAASGSRVFITTDGGSTWAERTDTINFPATLITRVVTHPHQDSTLFVVFGGFTAGSSLFMSTDLGVSWTNVTADLPNVPHSDLFVDPQFHNSQVMYVANDLGVYSTNDGGGSWQRESNGMPIVPALDFDYHFGERRLYVATHGRSVFQAQLPLAALAVTSPNGGEKFAIGGTYTIRWIGSGFGNPETVRLEYSLNNGATWQLLQDNVENTGSFNWQVPANIPPTNQALIRVIHPGNDNILDASNAVFSIFRDAFFTVNNSSPFNTHLGTFTSVGWGDFDNDGDLDISLTSEHPTAPSLRLYRNGEGATFSTVNPGIQPSQAFGASWGDFDRDGDLDLMAAGIQKKLLRNLGNGTFADATNAVFSNLPVAEFTSVSWVDFNRDNQLDLFATTGRYETGKNSRNVLFLQNTPGQLTDTYLDGNFDSRNAVWGDYNNDGFPDLFVVNHGGQPNQLYTTIKDGADVLFSDQVLNFDPGSNSNAAAWGDYDNDGDLDLFIANDGPNALYRNEGNGSFVKVNGAAIDAVSGESKTCTWGDFDNDGHLDLFVGNDGLNSLFRNLGNGDFEPIELSAVTTVDDYTSSAAWGDYDSDGDLDLLVANGVVGTSNTETNLLYRNKANGNGNNWLQVQLHGVISNLTGIGARITLYHQGQSESAPANGQAAGAAHSSLQIREISGLSGTGQNSPVAHFGLGAITQIDSLVVEWPSRRRTIITDIFANQRLTVFELENNRFVQTEGGGLKSAFKMRASAWGDINNDGQEDLILTGAGGKKWLYINKGNGRFEEQKLGERANNVDHFTAATLADDDNDGDLDVFISNREGQNLLFVNSGPPDFKLLPEIRGKVVEDKDPSTAAAWGDFNNDGLVDLFVANTSSNALYINKGEQNFSRLSTGPVVTDRGTATGGTWVDFDDDGDLDLFVTYSDRKDILYRNSGPPQYTFSSVAAGKLVESQPPTLGASWRDFDHDGDLDVFLLKTGVNQLYLNNGDGTFTRTTQGDFDLDQALSRSSAWSDASNDGFPSLFVANDGTNQLYEATTEQSLIRSPVTAATLLSGSHTGVSWADADGDGYADLVINNASGSSQLFRNAGGNNNWIKITCIGTISNASAIGARISVKADLDAKLPGVWQTVEISAQTGTGSQNSLTQLIGLRQATVVDSLIVDWPRSSPMVLTGVSANQHLILREKVGVRFRQDKQDAITKLSIDAGGITWADYDNDGDQDVFITTLQNENVLLTNNKGTFEKNDKSGLTEAAMPSNAATWADFDNDGLLDVFVVNRGDRSLLFRNQGSGTFAEITGGDIGGIKTLATSAAWGDFDNDGLVDLFISTSGKGNLLLRNRGKQAFEMVKAGDLTSRAFDSRAAAWGDFDNDGLADLFVANADRPNQLFRNEGGGKFVTVTGQPFAQDNGVSVGCSWGDYDNDGWLDLFVANQGGVDFLYHNSGDGNFTKVMGTPITATAGPSQGSGWVDFDNDGDLDLFVTAFGSESSLFRNLGNGLFEQESTTPLTVGREKKRGHAWADFDGNGTPDVFVALAGTPQFFQNANNGNNWIRLELRGNISNRAAIGARVRLKAFISGRAVWQTKQVSAQSGGGLSGQNSLWLTFGLGNAATVDSVIIHWPSGTTQILTNLRANQRRRVEESLPTSVESSPEQPAEYVLYQNHPNPFNPATTFRFSLPQQEHVILRIFDLRGRELVTLVNAPQPAGTHAIRFDASHLPSGVYVYQIQAGKFRDAKKFLLVK